MRVDRSTEPGGSRAIVAIDGPAGAGKTSVASRLAEALRLPYVNTGLMYRAVASEALRRGIDTGDGPALAELARSLSFSLVDLGSGAALSVEGRISRDELATAEVESVVSQVSAHPEVRSALREEQRRLGRAGGVVEGRDIGSVVFPDATVKIFLEGDPGVRAARRQKERGSEDPAMAEALARRDSLDSRVNPLVPAADAHLVDTTGRALDDVVREVLAIVRAAGVRSRGDR